MLSGYRGVETNARDAELSRAILGELHEPAAETAALFRGVDGELIDVDVWFIAFRGSSAQA